MRAQKLLTFDLPLLLPIDKVSRAISLMDEYKVAHLPIVVEDQFQGLIKEEDLLEHEDTAVLAEVTTYQISVDPNLHLYDVVAQMSRAEVDILPVVFQGKYMGSIDRGAVMSFLTKEAGWGLEGSTVILEITSAKYSLAEISRLVEENSTQITSFNMTQKDSGSLIVTIKLNTTKIAAILSSFERFDYKILTFFNSPEVEDELRSKFDAFMRYLETD
ncbi:MAG: CBS domain-containing protein [Flavobacteriales bacterium]|nr:CBS domain-containing protein [Flavobacteriales bacterium]